jgi:hypothetical protein
VSTESAGPSTISAPLTGLARWRPFGQSESLRSSDPEWEFARVNILRLVLLGLAALSWIVGGAAILQKAGRPKTPSASSIATTPTTSGELRVWSHEIAAARRAFEEELKRAPEYESFFTRLREDFPSEYGSFIVGLARHPAATGEIGNADFLLAEAVRSLRLSRGVLAAKAGRTALERLFELQLAMLQALAANDPHLCVDFLYGSESNAFVEFSAQNRSLVAAIAVAGIDAIQDGQLKQIQREAPTGTDFDALEKGLRAKGLTTPEIEALLDAKASNPPIDEAKMCRAGQVYLETLAALPEESRLRIYALAVELMARS